MDEPLAKVAGNGLEVLHAVRFLNNQLIDGRVHEVTVRLGMELLLSTGLAKAADEARMKLENSLTSGKAAEIFARMAAALGGPKDFIDAPERHLRAAPIIRPVFSDAEGNVTRIATRELGLAVIELGGGRRRAEDKIDHAVGLDQLLGKNFISNMNTPLCMIHARDEASFERAAQIVKAAYQIGDGAESWSPILERVAP
jgi:thymidine phosphorylase